MQRYIVYLYLETARVLLPPIIRSAYNCIYSIWYLSHRYCYLPLSWKSWNWFECAAGGVRHTRTGTPSLLHFSYLSYPPSQERLLPGWSPLMSPALASCIHFPGIPPNSSRQLFKTAPVSCRLLPRTGTQELPPSSGFPKAAPKAGFSKTLSRLLITDSQDCVFNTDSSRLTLPNWLPRLTVPKTFHNWLQKLCLLPLIP